MMSDRPSANRGVVKVECSPNGILPDSARSVPVKTFDEQFSRMKFLSKEFAHIGDSLRYRSEEMQSILRETERMTSYWSTNKGHPSRPCERCPKLERRNRNQESLNTRLINLARKLAQIVPRNNACYAACLRELNELSKLMSRREETIVNNDGSMESACGRVETAAIESSSKQVPRLDEAATIEPTKSVHRSEAIVDKLSKSVPQIAETDANKTNIWDESTIDKSPERIKLKESPVVERPRNNKRRLKCISTKKRNKVENGESIVNCDSDSEFPDFEVISYPSKSRAATPDVLDINSNVAPPDKIRLLETPTVRQRETSIVGQAETPKTDEPSLNSIEDIIEPTQKAPSRRFGSRGRRSLVFHKPNLNDATIEQLPDERTRIVPEKTSPLNVIITSSNNKSPNKCVKVKKADKVEELVSKSSKAHADDTKKKNLEMKWSLAPSRQPTNSKLKQTLLTTTAVQKKTDITKQEKFSGGLLRSAETKKTENEELLPTKVSDESSVAPTFDSAITSTVNVVFKTPLKNEKADKFSKYANKVVDNSFDVIPKTSPSFKYQREAVRKKCERRKLPGQDCDCCTEFYGRVAEDVGETQAQIMMDKFSRHRDKNPVKSNTPSGFWNPVFDTNDEMLVMSRP